MNSSANLTDRQERILVFIDYYIGARGISPTVREIGQATGLSSVSSVGHHLSVLAGRGLLKYTKGSPRSITLLQTERQAAAAVSVTQVPVLPRDVPTWPLPVEAMEGFHPMPRGQVGNGVVVAVRVPDESMIAANIFPKDLAFIRCDDELTHGDVVAAVVNEHMIIRRLAYQDGARWLRPDTRATDVGPIAGSAALIVGKAVELRRSL